MLLIFGIAIIVVAITIWWWLFSARATKIPRRIFLLNLSLASLIGMGIWALSPIVTGEKEPWDSTSLYYPFALLLVGLLLGIVYPRALWVYPIGIILGQIVYSIAVIGLAPLMPIGIMFVVAFTALTIVGVTVGMGIRGLLVRINHKS